jgi:ATP-dependent protease ClpP protease subunit
VFNLLKWIKDNHFESPYANEHSARLLSPNTSHIRVRRTNGSGQGTVQGVKIPASISIIWYITKSGNQEIPRAQALRFPISRWSEQQARAWLKNNKIKFMLFEPASKPQDNMKAEITVTKIDDDTAEMLLYGAVGWEMNGDEVAEKIQELNEQGVGTIIERINSGGGEVVNGLSVVAANLHSKAKIITINDGFAASMAGIILMTGKEIHMADYGVLMIHEPSLGSETIEKTKDPKVKKGLIAIRDSLSKIIQIRTGKKKSEINKLMNEETWYNANKAKKEGFIDKIINTRKQLEKQENSKLKAEILKATEDGSKWNITVINSGYANTSTGKVYLSPEVIKASVDMFNMDVFAHQFGNTPDGKMDLRHRPKGVDEKPFILNRIGFVDNVKAEDIGGVTKANGIFHVINPVVRQTLLETWNTDRSRMPEFSIDADYEGERIGDANHIKRFVKTHSLDMVTEGAFSEAKVNKLIASKYNIGEKQMNELLKKILANIKAGKMQLADSIEGKTDDEVLAMIKASLGITEDNSAKIEAIVKKALEDFTGMDDIKEIKTKLDKLVNEDEDEDEKEEEEKEDDDDTKEDDDKEDDEEEKKENDEEVKEEIKKQAQEIANLKMQASQNMIDSLLASDNTLDDITKGRIKSFFSGKLAKKEEVENHIKETKKYLDKILASNKINGKPIVVTNDNPTDKKRKLLAVFIDPKLNEEEGYKFPYHEIPKSLQEVLQMWTGHTHFQGTETMKAATVGSFTYIFQDVMNKQIRKQVNMQMVQSAIAKLVEEVSIDTLDQQHIYDTGYFGLIDDVLEDQAYTEKLEPGDIEATYTPKKIGNLFVITEEMLFTSGNKVTQLVRQYPNKLAASAKATVQKFIMDLITGCDGSNGANAQTIYTGGVLYTAGQGNYTTSALDFSTFDTAYVAMNNMTVLNGPFPAEIQPRYLLVPTELRGIARRICNNPTYAVKDDEAGTTGAAAVGNPYAADGVEPLVVPKYYLCNDANNWYLICNKNNAPTVQIGYFQNQRSPQLLLQNDPTQGATFSNDRWTWKVKWRFGGAVTDWKGMYGGIVAG